MGQHFELIYREINHESNPDALSMPLGLAKDGREQLFHVGSLEREAKTRRTKEITVFQGERLFAEGEGKH